MHVSILYSTCCQQSSINQPQKYIENLNNSHNRTSYTEPNFDNVLQVNTRQAKVSGKDSNTPAASIFVYFHLYPHLSHHMSTVWS